MCVADTRQKSGVVISKKTCLLLRDATKQAHMPKGYVQKVPKSEGGRSCKNIVGGTDVQVVVIFVFSIFVVTTD